MQFIIKINDNLRHEFWFPQSKPDPHSPECLTITLQGDVKITDQISMHKGNRIFHTAKQLGRVVAEPGKDVKVKICVIRAAHIEEDSFDYGEQFPHSITPLTRPNAGRWNCNRMLNPEIVENLKHVNKQIIIKSSEI